MDKHIIVCGYGRNGSKAVEELLKNNKKMVVIDTRAETFQNTQHGNFVFMEGNGTSDEILNAAGIQKASVIITTLPDDADNVFITLTAREMNPSIKIIARASNPNAVNKLKRAGADHIVMPELVGGYHMASLIIRPDVMEFAELAETDIKHNLRLESVGVKELRQEYKNKTLGDLDPTAKGAVIVVGIKNAERGFIFKPDQTFQLNENDKLLIMGDDAAISSFRKKFTV